MEYIPQEFNQPKQFKDLKLWLVDDDADLCEAYFEYLSEFFDIPFRFKSSVDALNALKAAQGIKIPDVIVVDRVMPQMDGLSLSKEISRLKIPTNVLMVSGDEKKLSAEESEAAHIFEMIQKPCSPVLIYEAIYRHWSKQKGGYDA